MSATSTIVVAAITAGSTLIAALGGSAGGYWLAGRNEARRDERKSARQSAARQEKQRGRLAEARSTFQRDTLLELQVELQRLVRSSVRIAQEDRANLKKHGTFYLLPGDLDQEAFAATVAVQRLREHILDDDLRDAVSAFVDRCVDVGLVVTRFSNPPPDPKAAVRAIERMEDRLDYDEMTKQVGAALRRELGHTLG